MAGEIGHVVYAARMLTYLGDSVSNPEYWVGTLFPDIRHLGVISRHRTHPENVSLHSLIGKNDFQTGMRVHAWIDATRERYLNDQHIKEGLPWHPFVPHALKLVEDEVLYDHFDDWNLIKRVLNKTYPDEVYYVSTKEHIHRWHSILQDYVSKKPTDKTRIELAHGIGLSDASAKEINSVVELLNNDERTFKLLDGFLQHLEEILQ